MVASNVHCVVVEIPAVERTRSQAFSPARELLPWADPYIVRLIAKLQAEVRAERAALRRPALAPSAEPKNHFTRSVDRVMRP